MYLCIVLVQKYVLKERASSHMPKFFTKVSCEESDEEKNRGLSIK